MNESKTSKIVSLPDEFKDHGNGNDDRRTFIYLGDLDTIFVAQNNAFHRDIWQWLFDNYPGKWNEEKENVALGLIERDYEDHALNCRMYWAEGMARLPSHIIDELSNTFGEKVYQRDWQYPATSLSDSFYEDYEDNPTAQWPTNSLDRITSAVHDALVDQVRNELTPDLLKPGFGRPDSPTAGHCYVASEAIYHLLGGPKSGLKPVRLRMDDGEVHWWLQGQDGSIIDATHDQFSHEIPYERGRPGGFLTREPSARAQKLMDRIKHNTMAESIPDDAVIGSSENPHLVLEGPLPLGENFLEWDGELQSTWDNHSIYYNVIDQDPEFHPDWDEYPIAGSINYVINDRGMGDPVTLKVHQVYVAPEYRNTNAFYMLVEPVLAAGIPIDASFQNPRLQAIFQKLIERGKINVVPSYTPKVFKEERLSGYEQQLEAGVLAKASAWQKNSDRHVLAYWQKTTADVRELAAKAYDQMMARPDVIKVYDLAKVWEDKYQSERGPGEAAKNFGKMLDPTMFTNEEFRKKNPEFDYDQANEIVLTHNGHILAGAIQSTLARMRNNYPAAYKLMPNAVKTLKGWANQGAESGVQWNRDPGAHVADIYGQAGTLLTTLRQQNQMPQGMDVNQMNFEDLQQWLYEYQAANVEDHGGGYRTNDVVFELPSGWKIVEIKDDDDLAIEGELMDHCVGGYCDMVSRGSSLIYSLRGPDNKPHVTIEILGQFMDDEGYGDTQMPPLMPQNVNPWQIVQIRGKSNSDPKPEYKAMIREWFMALQAKGVNLEHYNHFADEDQIYRLDDLMGWYEQYTPGQDVARDEYGIPKNAGDVWFDPDSLALDIVANEINERGQYRADDLQNALTTLITVEAKDPIKSMTTAYESARTKLDDEWDTFENNNFDAIYEDAAYAWEEENPGEDYETFRSNPATEDQAYELEGKIRDAAYEQYFGRARAFVMNLYNALEALKQTTTQPEWEPKASSWKLGSTVEWVETRPQGPHGGGLPWIYVPDYDTLYIGTTEDYHRLLITNDSNLRAHIEVDQYQDGPHKTIVAGRIDEEGNYSIYDKETMEVTLNTAKAVSALQEAWPEIQVAYANLPEAGHTTPEGGSLIHFPDGQVKTARNPTNLLLPVNPVGTQGFYAFIYSPKSDALLVQPGGIHRELGPLFKRNFGDPGQDAIYGWARNGNVYQPGLGDVSPELTQRVLALTESRTSAWKLANIIVVPSTIFAGRRFYSAPQFAFLYDRGQLYITRGHHPDILYSLSPDIRKQVKQDFRAGLSAWGWYDREGTINFDSGNMDSIYGKDTPLTNEARAYVTQNLQTIQDLLDDDDEPIKQDETEFNKAFEDYQSAARVPRRWLKLKDGTILNDADIPYDTWNHRQVARYYGIRLKDCDSIGMCNLNGYPLEAYDFDANPLTKEYYEYEFDRGDDDPMFYERKRSKTGEVEGEYRGLRPLIRLIDGTVYEGMQDQTHRGLFQRLWYDGKLKSSEDVADYGLLDGTLDDPDLDPSAFWWAGENHHPDIDMMMNSKMAGMYVNRWILRNNEVYRNNGEDSTHAELAHRLFPDQSMKKVYTNGATGYYDQDGEPYVEFNFTGKSDQDVEAQVRGAEQLSLFNSSIRENTSALRTAGFTCAFGYIDGRLWTDKSGHPFIMHDQCDRLFGGDRNAWREWINNHPSVWGLIVDGNVVWYSDSIENSGGPEMQAEAIDVLKNEGYLPKQLGLLNSSIGENKTATTINTLPGEGHGFGDIPFVYQPSTDTLTMTDGPGNHRTILKALRGEDMGYMERKRLNPNDLILGEFLEPARPGSMGEHLYPDPTVQVYAQPNQVPKPLVDALMRVWPGVQIVSEDIAGDYSQEVLVPKSDQLSLFSASSNSSYRENKTAMPVERDDFIYGYRDGQLKVAPGSAEHRNLRMPSDWKTVFGWVQSNGIHHYDFNNPKEEAIAQAYAAVQHYIETGSTQYGLLNSQHRENTAKWSWRRKDNDHAWVYLPDTDELLTGEDHPSLVAYQLSQRAGYDPAQVEQIMDGYYDSDEPMVQAYYQMYDKTQQWAKDHALFGWTSNDGEPYLWSETQGNDAGLLNSYREKALARARDNTLAHSDELARHSSHRATVTGAIYARLPVLWDESGVYVGGVQDHHADILWKYDLASPTDEGALAHYHQGDVNVEKDGDTLTLNVLGVPEQDKAYVKQQAERILEEWWAEWGKDEHTATKHTGKYTANALVPPRTGVRPESRLSRSMPYVKGLWETGLSTSAMDSQPAFDAWVSTMDELSQGRIYPRGSLTPTVPTHLDRKHPHQTLPFRVPPIGTRTPIFRSHKFSSFSVIPPENTTKGHDAIVYDPATDHLYVCPNGHHRAIFKNVPELKGKYDSLGLYEVYHANGDITELFVDQDPIDFANASRMQSRAQELYNEYQENSRDSLTPPIAASGINSVENYTIIDPDSAVTLGHDACIYVPDIDHLYICPNGHHRAIFKAYPELRNILWNCGIYEVNHQTMTSFGMAPDESNPATYDNLARADDIYMEYKKTTLPTNTASMVRQGGNVPHVEMFNANTDGNHHALLYSPVYDTLWIAWNGHHRDIRNHYPEAQKCALFIWTDAEFGTLGEWHMSNGEVCPQERADILDQAYTLAKQQDVDSYKSSVVKQSDDQWDIQAIDVGYDDHVAIIIFPQSKQFYIAFGGHHRDLIKAYGLRERLPRATAVEPWSAYEVDEFGTVEYDGGATHFPQSDPYFDEEEVVKQLFDQVRQERMDSSDTQSPNERPQNESLESVDTPKISAYNESDITVIKNFTTEGHDAVIYDALNDHLYICMNGHHRALRKEFPYLDQLDENNIGYYESSFGKPLRPEWDEGGTYDNLARAQELYNEWFNSEFVSPEDRASKVSSAPTVQYIPEDGKRIDSVRTPILWDSSNNTVYIGDRGGTHPPLLEAAKGIRMHMSEVPLKRQEIYETLAAGLYTPEGDEKPWTTAIPGYVDWFYGPDVPSQVSETIKNYCEHQYVEPQSMYPISKVAATNDYFHSWIYCPHAGGLHINTEPDSNHREILNEMNIRAKELMEPPYSPFVAGQIWVDTEDQISRFTLNSDLFQYGEDIGYEPPDPYFGLGLKATQEVIAWYKEHYPGWSLIDDSREVLTKVATWMSPIRPDAIGSSFFCWAYLPIQDRLYIDGVSYHSQLWDEWPELRTAVKAKEPSLWGQVDVGYAGEPEIKLQSDWFGYEDEPHGDEEGNQYDELGQPVPTEGMQQSKYFYKAKNLVLQWLQQNDYVEKTAAFEPAQVKWIGEPTRNAIWVWHLPSNTLVFASMFQTYHRIIMREMEPEANIRDANKLFLIGELDNLATPSGDMIEITDRDGHPYPNPDVFEAVYDAYRSSGGDSLPVGHPGITSSFTQVPESEAASRWGGLPFIITPEGRLYVSDDPEQHHRDLAKMLGLSKYDIGTAGIIFPDGTFTILWGYGMTPEGDDDVAETLDSLPDSVWDEGFGLEKYAAERPNGSDWDGSWFYFPDTDELFATSPTEKNQDHRSLRKTYPELRKRMKDEPFVAGWYTYPYDLQWDIGAYEQNLDRSKGIKVVPWGSDWLETGQDGYTDPLDPDTHDDQSVVPRVVELSKEKFPGLHFTG